MSEQTIQSTTVGSAGLQRAAALLRSGGVPFAAGLVFALGLGVSGMTQPAKIIGFLDVAGAWDPSLAFVMGGAVGTYFLMLRLARRRLDGSRREGAAPAKRGTLAQNAREILSERRMLAGSALFGIGWGLVGLCPGPALVTTVTGLPEVAVFVAAMTGAMLAVRFAPQVGQRLRGVSASQVPPAAPQECGPAVAREAA